MGLKAVLDARKAYAAHIAGNRLSDEKQFDKAEEKFEEALRLYKSAYDMGDRQVRYMMAYGVLLMKKGRFEESHDIMLETGKLPGRTNDEKWQLRLNFAICEWKLGHLDHAIELMRQVASLKKTSTVYGSLGYMLIEKAKQTQDFSSADEFNAEAYEYDEEDAVTLDNLGQLALAKGRRDEAKKWFLKAVSIKPGQVDTLYYLALLAYEDSDAATAREYINRALSAKYSALCTTTREMAVELSKKID